MLLMLAIDQCTSMHTIVISCMLLNIHVTNEIGLKFCHFIF